MLERSPFEPPQIPLSSPSFEVDLHRANPDLYSYDHGAAVAAAALHAVSSDALRSTFEKPPLTDVEIITANGKLIEMLRSARTL